MNQSTTLPASPTPAHPPAHDGTSLPIVPHHAIRELSPTALEGLRRVFEARAAMLPISVSHPQPQAPADPWSIFELRKSGSDYTLVPTVPGPSLVPPADGMFVYVVRADDPGRVYVGVPYGRVGIDQERFGIQGHTSLTHRADVLYAGEIILEQGKLTSWGNSSGHYRPPADRHVSNLLPATQTLLPEGKFVDYWRQGNAERQAQLGQMRGYLNMTDPQAPAAGGSAGSAGSAGSSSPSSPDGPVERLRLRVGNSEMRWDHLSDLGAMIDGQPLQVALRRPSTPSLLQNGLADRLSFDGSILEQQIQAQRISGIDNLLFELAGQRSGNGPVLVDAGNRPWIAQMNLMLSHVQELSAPASYGSRQNTVTCLLPGDNAVRHTALGLHLFGLYNGVRALRTAVARGDTAGSIVAASELAAAGVGIGVEEGLQRVGAAVQRGTARSLDQFARTAIGMRLGGPSRLGANLARSAPLVGALITAPFDAYNVINSLQQAGGSEGRQAQDHYVDAGLATTSLVTTVGLGAAGYAGFASAGPIGIGVGALLVVAGRTYHSIRYVQDLLEKVPLSRGEVMSTGLLNVIGMGPTQQVQDRLTIHTAAAGYRDQMRRELQSVQQDLAVLGAGHIVFGDASIRLRAPLLSIERLSVSTLAGGEVEVQRTTEIPQPPIVVGNAGDDIIDARSGLDAVGNVVAVASATDDKVLWMTGTGDDTLAGVWNRDNLFDVRGGKKTLRGGHESDVFWLQVAPQDGSSFDGRLGSDTLQLAFPAAADTTLEVALAGHPSRADYRVIENHLYDNYQVAGSLSWATYLYENPGPPHRTEPGWIDVGGKRSALRSIENVVTASGATTRILGNGQDNVFVLNGRGDSVDGGLGNDTYLIQGGGTIRVKAGAGTNRYQLQRTIESVEIDSARAGRHTLHFDFDLHELLFEAKAQSVEISVAGNAGQRVVLKDIYREQEAGGREAVRPDGQLRVMTRDAMAVTPLFSKCVQAGDNLIELLAKPLTDPASPENDRFATAQEMQQLDHLVAISGGWQPALGTASAANAGSADAHRNDPLVGGLSMLAA